MTRIPEVADISVADIVTLTWVVVWLLVELLRRSYLYRLNWY